LGLQGIIERNMPLDIWGFEFWILVEFGFVVHVDGDLGIAQEWEFLEIEDICRYTFLE